MSDLLYLQTYSEFSFLILFTFSIDRSHNFFKTCQGSLHILNNFVCENIRVRQIVQISEAFVFEPENIQFRFIPSYNFIIDEFSEPALWRFALQVSLRL